MILEEKQIGKATITSTGAGTVTPPATPSTGDIASFVAEHKKIKAHLDKGGCMTIDNIATMFKLTPERVNDHMTVFEIDKYLVKPTTGVVCSFDAVNRMVKALEQMRRLY